MSDCIHCEIHDLLEAHLQSATADLAVVAAKVTEVLADLVMMAPEADRTMLMADVLSNLGQFVLEKSEATEGAEGSGRPPHSAH